VYTIAIIQLRVIRLFYFRQISQIVVVTNFSNVLKFLNIPYNLFRKHIILYVRIKLVSVLYSGGIIYTIQHLHFITIIYSILLRIIIA